MRKSCSGHLVPIAKLKSQPRPGPPASGVRWASEQQGPSPQVRPGKVKKYVLSFHICAFREREREMEAGPAHAQVWRSRSQLGAHGNRPSPLLGATLGFCK